MSPPLTSDNEAAKATQKEADESILLLRSKNSQLEEENESLKNMCKHFESVVSQLIL